MDWRSPIFIADICSLAIALPCSAPNCSSSVASVVATPTELSINQLHQLARSLTVKVLSKDVLGSGTLMQKQGSVYIAIANEHVLRTAKPPYRIQTPDGHIYPASAFKTKGREDIALLKFRSNGTVYNVASVKKSSRLAVGDRVFAAGFPIVESADRAQQEFIFTTGQVSLLLDKALEGGYQIGYTNNIQKGMSGGPVLNRRGQVIGINGMHANPLWDAPDLYQDGSQPCPQLQDAIARLSWAVPIVKLQTQQAEAAKSCQGE